MSNTRSSNKTLSVLMLFLLFFALFSVTALYLDLRRQYATLTEENARLADSQVLLMVPEGQAAALAEWLESHPEQTGHLIDHAVKQKSVQSPKGPEFDKSSPPGKVKEVPAINTAQGEHGSSAVNPLSQDADKASSQHFPNALVPVIVSESGNGVKVIALPNGGIRVTTRDENQ